MNSSKTPNVSYCKNQVTVSMGKSKTKLHRNNYFINITKMSVVAIVVALYRQKQTIWYFRNIYRWIFVRFS